MNQIKRIGIALVFAFSVHQASAVGFGVWGAYNFSTITGVDCKNIWIDCSSYKGGLAFGADLWLFGVGPVQLGVTGAYLPLYSQKYSKKDTQTNTNIQIESGAFYVVPSLGARVTVPFMGVFVGAGAGPAFAVATLKSRGNTVPIDSKTQFALQVMVGKEFSLGPLSLDLAVRYYLARAQIFAEDSSSSTESVSNILPSVGVTLAF